MKAVTVLVDRQLYGSEFQTEGELRLNDFADIVRDIVSETACQNVDTSTLSVISYM